MKSSKKHVLIILFLIIAAVFPSFSGCDNHGKSDVPAISLVHHISGTPYRVVEFNRTVWIVTLLENGLFGIYDTDGSRIKENGYGFFTIEG